MTESVAGTLAGISVWDGERELGPTTVTWANDALEVSPAEADLLGGYSLIPGLIDTHVHLDTNVLTGQGPGDAWQLVTPDAEKSLHVVAHTRRFAEFGITTMRDLAASPIEMAVGRALDQGVLEGPRLLTNGPVGMTAGHGDLFTPPRYRIRPPVADSPDECRRLVRQWAREGSTGIKIYTSGGIFSMGDKVGWRNQTLAEIEATVDEAHALDMLVAAHSHTPEGIDIALNVGVDSIEHATGMTEAQFERLIETNTPVTPTLIINDVVAGGLDGMRADATAKARDVVAGRDAAFLAAGRAGVRFVLGTDANGRFVRHGEQLKEIRMMRAAFDWTPERALVAATSDAADSLRLGHQLGRIRSGHAADFIVLRGRPWEHIDDLAAENIQAVVSRGRLVAGSLPVSS